MSLTINQEAFCIFVARGETKTDAFVKAGYSPKGAGTNSSKLAAQPHVARRIKELSNAVAKGQKIEVPEEVIDQPPRISVSRNAKLINFANPDIAWIREEIYTNMCCAREDANYKEANEAANMLLKTMFTPDVPKTPLGRPRNYKEPNKGDEDPNNDKPQNPINVSIFNQFAERVDRTTGDEPASPDSSIVDITRAPDRNLPDLRASSTVVGMPGSPGEVREGVPRETSGSGSE